MAHQHQYDSEGNQLCCLKEKKIYKDAGAADLLKNTSNDDCCSHESKTHQHSTHEDDEQEHEHSHDFSISSFKIWLPIIISAFILLLTLVLEKYFQLPWMQGWIRFCFYALAFLPVGLPVLKEAFFSIKKGAVFSEFFLMGIATLGAFSIGEYPEAVAVMLFYAIGELFQTLAVARAKNNIQSLLDQRPDEVQVVKNEAIEIVHAAKVPIGAILQLKPGEQLALDGILVSEMASFNTAALTGESVPQTISKGEPVLAGMINLNQLVQVETTALYADSKLSKILALVQDASAQKAPTELFIRKFAKIYTPIVVILALAICFLPYFFVAEYQFQQWLYRALVFLVISCPCALVISIPLGYFGGIGAGSRHGILFKGSHFLDLIAKIQNVVMDKTGTITEGVFKVQEVWVHQDWDKKSILNKVALAESKSSHPVASAVLEFVGAIDNIDKLESVEEIPGHGLKASINGQEVLVGNAKLMELFKIENQYYPQDSLHTLLAVAIEKNFVACISIADQIKAETPQAIQSLKSLGVKLWMLSGDKNTVVQNVAQKLGIDQAFGDLLPADKVEKVKSIKAKNETVAFVGDGLNDAPVVALSDVGIAMGGLGSDATIESADIVIQDDKTIKIPLAIKIGRATQNIVWQNIIFAFAVKILVLILGAGGLATMWEAVFADVGVALLAILNAMRIQRKNFTV